VAAPSNDDHIAATESYRSLSVILNERTKILKSASRVIHLLPLLLVCPFAFGQDNSAITAKMEQVRDKHHLPTLAAIAMIDGEVRYLNAIGVRKLGSPEKVTPDDKWHIGSCTKSMTATLAAMFVEQGKLNWNTTVGNVFSEWRDEIHPDWRGVTIEQLLQHRGGAPHDAPRDLWALAWKKIGSPMEQRREFVHGLLTRPPAIPPGTKFEYSNQGYAIAGAMLEHITKEPWEKLIREMLFERLEMKSAGFGAPATPGKIDQPWGHTKKNNKPVPPGPKADNPPAIAPAGTVHCSLTDLAHYADLHARGQFADTPLLKHQSFLKLHTAPPGQDYAMGWIVASRSWAGGTALTHVGSNTTFLVDIWVAPEKHAVLIAATNTAEDATRAADEMIGVLVRRFLKQPE
jgi:CubicO group peptidase (beta-lactamase class C family)